PCRLLAHALTYLFRMLADARREHDGIEPLQRGAHRADLASDAIHVEIDGETRAFVAAREERTHVARDAGYAQQARAAIQQVFDLACVHAEFVEQIQDHARIEIAA